MKDIEPNALQDDPLLNIPRVAVQSAPPEVHDGVGPRVNVAEFPSDATFRYC